VLNKTGGRVKHGEAPCLTRMVGVVNKKVELFNTDFNGIKKRALVFPPKGDVLLQIETYCFSYAGKNKVGGKTVSFSSYSI
jgi:hypothetical protein